MLNSLLLQSLMEAAKPKDDEDEKKKKKTDDSESEKDEPQEDDVKDSGDDADDSASDQDDPKDDASDDGTDPEDSPADDSETGDTPPDDFNMDDDDAASDDNGPPPDGLADPDAEDDDSMQDVETNVHVNILNLSKIDRALAKRKLLNDFFSLRASMKTMLTVIDNNQAVLDAEVRDPLITDINQLYEALTDYITIKFSYINYEENLQNYIIFSKSFEEMIQRANTNT